MSEQSPEATKEALVEEIEQLAERADLAVTIGSDADNVLCQIHQGAPDMIGFALEKLTDRHMVSVTPADHEIHLTIPFKTDEV
jgi:hypothetical protein